MDLPEVSIITRCRNRLEYTVQVLDAVKRNSFLPYEHIIVDNASEDGTQEWFRWMAQNTSWYHNLRYFRMPRNVGDWGGMLAGFAQSRGKYIVQLDNDIIPSPHWLSAMCAVLDDSQYKVIMLKRSNVFGKWVLKPLSEIRKVQGVQVCRVERAVACYMMHRDSFKVLADRIPEGQGMKSKYIMAKLLHPIGKILDITCHELEATEDMVLTGTDQRSKYPPMIDGKPNPQVWEKV